MSLRAALLGLLLALQACAGAQQTGSRAAPVAEAGGRFIEEGAIKVAGLPDQRITIWLPPGYDAEGRHYPVLYMHDGHNLFDPAKSNFNKVWAVDKALISLVANGTIEPHIVVGIWAPGRDRFRQYLPQVASEAAKGDLARKISDGLNGGAVVSARYLQWIADELKPRIDREFRTKGGVSDTAIAGSSMGGIMSCYTIVERPDVFGRAACVSSHWPIVMPDASDTLRGEVSAMWRDWLAPRLGQPNGRRIWMDHGTATLDAHYAPYQRVIDAEFRAAGWIEGRDWVSREYVGAEHEENAWARRLPEVLGWLLAGDGSLANPAN